MLTLIGTGLCDALDLTLRGRQAIEDAERVYLEGYTSLLRCTPEEYARVIGKPITVLSREDVEQRIGPILEHAKRGEVALLVIGDPFAATTHADLMLRAREAGVAVKVIHNATILSAVGEVGLELYRYGRTVSVPYWQPGFEPVSFLDGIRENGARGLHTLCLLDIKTDEHRVMTVAEGAALVLRAEERARTGAVGEETLAVGVARLGWPDQEVRVGTLGALKGADLGGPPHCIILPGRLHLVEEEMLKNTTKQG